MGRSMFRCVKLRIIIFLALCAIVVSEDLPRAADMIKLFSTSAVFAGIAENWWLTEQPEQT